jgi:tetratricopeptide (TPR) repeat protein
MQTGTEPKTRLVEQINACLRSGGYSRALDLLRGAATEFPDDAELSQLETLAQDGVKHKAQADRLITESQGLFAQQKSAEAIQLLRKAYELDKNNSLARNILANALVEHAISIVEIDWWEAATLAKQALELNPAHPTAKTIRDLIRDLKKAGSVEKWIAQARKRQSSSDLSAAISLIAEALVIHPREAKLLLIHDELQRDQDTRRRQTRRGDLEDLRRMESELDGAADIVSKKAFAERIQAVAARHWTDGEILSVANTLLQRLGLVPKGSSAAAPHAKGATVIFQVPRLSPPEPPPSATSQVPVSSAPQGPVLPIEVLPNQALPNQVPPNTVPPAKAPAAIVPPSKIPLKTTARDKTRIAPPELQLSPQQAATVLTVEPPAPAANAASLSSKPKDSTRSNATILIFVSAAVIILVAATFFFTRRHYSPSVATNHGAAPVVSAPAVAAPTVSAPAASTPVASSPVPTNPEPSAPVLPPSTDAAPGKVTPHDQLGEDQPSTVSSHEVGTLLVVAGQEEARVFLNGKIQRQLTQAGQLRIPDLAPKDYVVQVSKSGFQDPPLQKIRIRKGEEARLSFNLQPQPQPQPRPQPQPSMASLTIQGGVPGVAVLLDQNLVGTIQADGTLSVSSVNPGDHTIELRKDRFKPRQLKKHFVAGATISLVAADAALEAAAGELKITFTPADASLAIVKGDLLKIVSSGVPLNLPAGTYTLTARTAERFTRWANIDVFAGQSKTLDLNLAPDGMSKWNDPGAWKHEGDSFIRKGGDFILYGAAPSAGTFVFSAMPAKGRVLQWVLNYTDSKNYVLCQLDDNSFSRAVIRNGQKADEIKVPDKVDKKGFRTLQIRVSPTEIVQQIKHGESWSTLDHWTQPGTNIGQGKFGFYLPGNDQVTVSSFAHYGELNTR